MQAARILRCSCALSIQDRYGLSSWDSLVVSAAQVAGCVWTLAEDLQHGQVLDGVTLIGPFGTVPEELLG